MSWNEPGGGKDPWGGGKGDGPPDLDEAWKKFREKFSRFGGGSGGSGGAGGGINPGKYLPVLLVLILAVWAFTGVYQVDEKERGVVLRFGQFHDIVAPGLHWNPPLIDTVTVVATTEVRQYQNDAEDLMLTEDENIVDLQISVQYNVPDPKSYVLRVKDPDISLRHATESALRHVVGGSELNQVISTGRAEIAEEIMGRLENYLDSYGTGIDVLAVNVLDAKPPAQVKAAYDDVIKAREDQERVINEAQSYANSVIPEARGNAKRMLEEAAGYEARVVAEAEGETQRFENLVVEYQQAPEVTRKRLYMESLQSVMTASSKVMVAADKGSNIFYLPLDKAVKSGEMTGDGSGSGSGLSASQISPLADEVVRRLEEQRESGNSNRRELR